MRVWSILTLQLLPVPVDYGYQLYLYRLIGLAGWVFTNGLRDWVSIPGRVIPKTEENGTWYRLVYYKVWIRDKVVQSRERSSILSYTSV